MIATNATHSRNDISVSGKPLTAICRLLTTANGIAQTLSGCLKPFLLLPLSRLMLPDKIVSRRFYRRLLRRSVVRLAMTI
ncbi:MAG: hypothetical protein IKI11_05890 [Neisseriaceae bacterium]|nr:hypothetical protein [Neisseriaceae bacterium]